MSSHVKTPAKQNGFVLILIVLSMLSIGAVLLFASYGEAISKNKINSVTVASNATAAETNNAAKQALISFVLNQTDDAIRPGALPLPDSLAFKTVSSPSDGVYDGMMDNKCLSNNTNGIPAEPLALSTNKRCLGKLPWKSLSMSFTAEADDKLGQVPWLAISANLASTFVDRVSNENLFFDYDNCLKVLNSNTTLLTSPTLPLPAACPLIAGPPYSALAALPHQWLTVRNASGQILSDKVAAVLIVPGIPITTETRVQARTALNPGNPSDYLDDIKLPLGCTVCTTHDNAGLTNQFIQLEPGTRYPDDSQDTTKRGTVIPFNDVLIYITIEELMYYAEQRVLKSMRKSLVAFKADTSKSGGMYPWMAPITGMFSDELSLTPAAGTVVGAFPFFVRSSATFGAQPFYRTGFSWSLNSTASSNPWRAVNSQSTSTPICYQIGTGPNRWLRNPLSNTLAASTPVGGPFRVGTASPTTGKCHWNGANKVSCEVNDVTFNRTMTVYSTQTRCNNQTNSSGSANFLIQRKLIIMSDCTAEPKTYALASPNGTHRWSWSCSGFTDADSLTVEETITNSSYNRLPRIAQLRSIGSNANLSVAGMDYRPEMPMWFYENQWYLNAFSARSPSSAPIPITNTCGAATSLTVGGVDGKDAVVMLAGRKLASQTQPSNSVTNYLEGLNTTSATTCQFEKGPNQGSSSGADQLIVVAP